MRWGVLGAALAVLCLGGCELPTAGDPAARFDAMVERDPVLEAIKLTDEPFYLELRTNAIQRQSAGASRRLVEQDLRAKLREYSMRKGRDLAAAPDDVLIQSFEAERDLIAKLQMQNVGLCADFAMGRPARTQIVPADLKYLYERVAVARLLGGLEGRKSPVRRQEASDEDLSAIYQEMMRWSVPEPLARQVIEKGLEGRSEDEQCDTVVALYEAVLAQPGPGAARIIAGIQKGIADRAGPAAPPA